MRVENRGKAAVTNTETVNVALGMPCRITTASVAWRERERNPGFQSKTTLRWSSPRGPSHQSHRIGQRSRRSDYPRPVPATPSLPYPSTRPITVRSGTSSSIRLSAVSSTCRAIQPRLVNASDGDHRLARSQHLAGVATRKAVQRRLRGSFAGLTTRKPTPATPNERLALRPRCRGGNLRVDGGEKPAPGQRPGSGSGGGIRTPDTRIMIPLL